MQRRYLFLPLLLAASALHSHADISFSQSIKVEAGGAMSMFGSTGEIITHLSGDKSRTDSEIKMDSSLARMVAGSGKTGTIVRLDKGIIQNLDPARAEYSEMTLAEARAQLEQAMEQAAEAQESRGGALPVDAEGYQWSQGDIEIEKPGGSVKIADIKTKHHIIRLRQSCTDPQTNRSCDITWVMETWLARKVPAEKEARKYREDYAKAMGLDEIDLQVAGPAQSLIAMFGENWDEVAEAAADMKGYPMRTVLQMGMGGEQCITESGQPIAMDDIWADASTAAYNTALDQAGYEAGRAIGRSAGSAIGNNVGGSIGGAAVGAAASEVIGGLTGMFKKKKKEPEPVPAAANPAAQQVTVFRVETEVTRWSELAVPPERYEPDPDWARVR